jgi:hypothetical protein
MNYSKNNKKVKERLEWNSFCKPNRELIQHIDLAPPTCETKDRFQDLLMHGNIDHHDDWSDFGLNELSTLKLLSEGSKQIDAYQPQSILYCCLRMSVHS